MEVTNESKEEDVRSHLEVEITKSDLTEENEESLTVTTEEEFRKRLAQIEEAAETELRETREILEATPGGDSVSASTSTEPREDEQFDFDSKAPPFSYEDYNLQIAEILEAEQDELLETQAILNAPPAAESVRISIGDEEKKSKLANATTYDELAVFEMDNIDIDETSATAEDTPVATEKQAEETELDAAAIIAPRNETDANEVDNNAVLPSNSEPSQEPEITKMEAVNGDDEEDDRDDAEID